MDFVVNNVTACAYHFFRYKSESRQNDGFAPNDNAAARGAEEPPRGSMQRGVVVCVPPPPRFYQVVGLGENETLFSLF
jgi:hypothetical protein